MMQRRGFLAAGLGLVAAPLVGAVNRINYRPGTTLVVNGLRIPFPKEGLDIKIEVDPKDNIVGPVRVEMNRPLIIQGNEEHGAALTINGPPNVGMFDFGIKLQAHPNHGLFIHTQEPIGGYLITGENHEP